MNFQNEEDIRVLQKSYAKVQSLFWSDQAFRAQLEQDPKAAIQGLEIPVGDVETIELLVNDGTNHYLVLPTMPANLAQSDINHIMAAGTLGTAGSVGSAGTVCGTAATFGSLGTFGCAEL